MVNGRYITYRRAFFNFNKRYYSFIYGAFCFFFFIGHYIILSGLRQEKKIEEKEEAEIEIELDLQQAQMKVLIEIKNKIEKIEKTIDDINSK